MQKTLWCPGRKYVTGTLVTTPKTATQWPTGKADCEFCGRNVPVELSTGKPRGHRITITIQDEEGGLSV